MGLAMRRHLWVLGLAALAGIIASFLIVDANYFLGAIMGAVSGVFVVLFMRAWPMDLDPRERNRMVITVKVDGKSTR